tara:strand:- start:781 stop:1221 length:441 start_codon:yes stop_codon:yes gene_type:complete
MKIQYAGNLAIWSIAGVILRPGVNDVPDDEWAKVRDFDSVVKARESSLLAELEPFLEPKEEPAKESKPDPASDTNPALLSALDMTQEELEKAGGLSRVDIREYHWNVAQDIVNLVDDVRILLCWDDVEHRASVKKALEAQLGDLRQ